MNAKYFVWLMVLINLIGVQTVMGSDRWQNPEATITNVVAISVAADKTSYEFGEEIILSVTVSNTSATTIRILDTGVVLSGFIADVHTENGHFAVVREALSQELKPNEERKQGARSMRLRTALPPGQVVTYSIPLERWIIVERAGIYRFALVRGENASRLMREASNSILIEVTPQKRPDLHQPGSVAVPN